MNRERAHRLGLRAEQISIRRSRRGKTVSSCGVLAHELRITTAATRGCWFECRFSEPFGSTIFLRSELSSFHFFLRFRLEYTIDTTESHAEKMNNSRKSTFHVYILRTIFTNDLRKTLTINCQGIAARSKTQESPFSHWNIRNNPDELIDQPLHICMYMYSIIIHRSQRESTYRK